MNYGNGLVQYCRHAADGNYAAKYLIGPLESDKHKILPITFQI